MNQNKFKSEMTEKLFVISMAVLLLSGCRAPRPDTDQNSFFAMGTVATVILPRDAADKLDRATRLVSQTLADIENRTSIYMPDSEISLVNINAGQDAVEVSPFVLDLLRLSKHYSELSDGAFDATVGPLMDAWGLRGGAPAPRRPPAPENIQALKQRVGWRNIVLKETTAALTAEGAELDLGGIAKGYAVDICSHRLLGENIENALIDLGGNIRCLGRRNGGEPWIIGVRNPFRPGRMLGSIWLSGGEAVATSGNYERFVTIEGKRYAHIMDPRTGSPVQGMAAVTVISHSAAEADALSTALFVQGIEAGSATLGKTSSRKALFVPDKQPIEIWITPALHERFRPGPEISDRVFLIAPGSAVPD